MRIAMDFVVKLVLFLLAWLHGTLFSSLLYLKTRACQIIRYGERSIRFKEAIGGLSFSEIWNILKRFN